jgi:hypothetical protein
VRRVVGCPQAAAVRFNDGTADPKPHAEAVRFGGKESIEYLVRLFRGQPTPVSLTEIISCRSSAPRSDDEFACSIDLLHRIDAVHDEVHHDLLHLHRVGHDLGKIGVKVGAD